MRIVVQRVSKSSVSVNGKIVGKISSGLNVLLAVKSGDTEEDARYLAGKLMRLRVFPDMNGKMNLSIQDTGGEVLVISQFTLYGDCRKGNRPSYSVSAPAEKASALYEYFISFIRENYINRIESGEFQANMDVEICNDGPVTLIIESRSN